MFVPCLLFSSWFVCVSVWAWRSISILASVICLPWPISLHTCNPSSNYDPAGYVLRLITVVASALLTLRPTSTAINSLLVCLSGRLLVLRLSAPQVHLFVVIPVCLLCTVFASPLPPMFCLHLYVNLIEPAVISQCMAEPLLPCLSTELPARP